jgi:hypothetical protein
VDAVTVEVDESKNLDELIRRGFTGEISKNLGGRPRAPRALYHTAQPYKHSHPARHPDAQEHSFSPMPTTLSLLVKVVVTLRLPKLSVA